MPFSPEQVITRHFLPEKVDFISGVVMLIDKPAGWTSFDVVNKIRFKLRYGLNTKKIKVGHAGTLDPMATGLLLVCTGKLTKKIDLLQGEDKAYSGTMKIGATTPTYDAESDPDELYATDHIIPDLIHKSRAEFIGYQMQVPPIYSALKIEGKPAYNLARRGKDIIMKARPVTIHTFDILNNDLSALRFFVNCGKGTYIRSLVFDFGKKLDSGAYLTSLRREAIGYYTVNDALDIEMATDYIEKATQDILK
ncbi:MAG: tRNA pseudouridine(55) synthase TruB [Saprospiraceae bacterium]|jgi:tRNA pseudouridine55 synthase